MEQFNNDSYLIKCNNKYEKQNHVGLTALPLNIYKLG